MVARIVQGCIYRGRLHRDGYGRRYHGGGDAVQLQQICNSVKIDPPVILSMFIWTRRYDDVAREESVISDALSDY